MPACGLYRTTRALADRPESVGPGLLVKFHNHSDEGPPVVLLPDHNRSNRWHFHRHSFHVRDPEFLDSLVALKPEGVYRLREHFHPDAERIVAANALVQLGYNREAEPILFFPTLDGETNSLTFPARGMKITDPVYQLLERLDLRGPHEPRKLH